MLRDADFAGRNGGEEFALLLPNTDISAATEIAERVRAAIEASGAELRYLPPYSPEFNPIEKAFSSSN